ncbi:MAG: hydroxyacylglutathione hydrolase [Robiginitomaculum sp.]|nr:hydroxyacylglutathione hydrolase [Robiginitomaculum sp.]
MLFGKGNQMIEVVQLPCLSDNYGFLVHDPKTKTTISIDSPDAAVINKALEDRNWSLSAIWNTHHHFDHAGGNAALVERWNCKIIAPKGDAKFIPNADQLVSDGDEVFLGGVMAKVLHTPGHTMGHIIYVFENENIAFVGDTLFALGCGRLFEGGPKEMWPSLQKVMALAPQTMIYCAHEYTADNLRFAITIDPDNPELIARGREIKTKRENDQWTIPFTLAEDLATNPFLRAADPAIRKRLGMQDASDQQVFAEIRQRKDNF